MCQPSLYSDAKCDLLHKMSWNPGDLYFTHDTTIDPKFEQEMGKDLE
jgi:hypothetical protein